MAVDPTTVAKGKCYRTSSDQHRRVYSVDADKVTYQSWGGKVGNHTGHLHRNTVNRNKFAADVEAEIPCPTGMEPFPNSARASILTLTRPTGSLFSPCGDFDD